MNAVKKSKPSLHTVLTPQLLDLYEIKDSTEKKLYEVRTKRNNIDTSKGLNNIVGNG